MRPYLAIIKDSFREALVSRVLVVVLVIITLLLVLMAPIGIEKKPGPAELGLFDVPNWVALSGAIQEEQQASGPAPGKIIVERMDPEVWDAMQKLAKGEQPRNPFLMVEEFNRILQQPNFYDKQAWADAELSEEAKTLLEQRESLNAKQTQRLNRLLLESAYPTLVSHKQATLYPSYLVWTLEWELPIPEKNIPELISGLIRVFMSYIIGTAGLLAAIVVTSYLIPQTFEQGTIDVLLSKPVSREWLFVSKFIGGCAFILLIVSYALLGLYLIAGLRFGLWFENLLFCIPVFVFTFAIYYSVSAFVGLLWRNAIICVVFTVLFFMGTFSLSSANTLFRSAWLEPRRLNTIVPTPSGVFAKNELGQIFRWQSSTDNWNEIFQVPRPEGEPPSLIPRSGLLGPHWDAQGERLIAVRVARGFGGDAPSAIYASEATQWRGEEGPSTPADTEAFFLDSKGRLVTVSPRGFFRLPQEKMEKKAFRLFGMELALPGDAFQKVGPTPSKYWLHPLNVAPHSSRDSVAVWSQKHLYVYELNSEDQYELKEQKRLYDESTAAVLGYGGNVVVLADKNGKIRILQGKELEQVEEFTPEGNNQPRFVEVSPDGRWFAVIFHNGRLWMYDAKQQAGFTPSLWRQGNILAAAFDGEAIWLVDDFTRVTKYSLADWSQQQRIVPEENFMEKCYRYGVEPLHWLLPKPNEFGNVNDYLLTSKETIGGPEEDLEQGQFKQDLWGFLWSGFGFIAFMLGLSCLYLRRAEF